MFESRISVGAKEKLLTRGSGKFDAEITSFLVPGHGRSREDMCGKILRTCEQIDSTIFKVATSFMDDHPFKEKRK